ncbi:uncharacterized protein [Diabrotica undecimpunctata]|uniref:uncharacterized protein n=1 Tax=Diabrotica undecimpunctata TaxID=50387 RepID=UPI003B632FA0
MATVSRETARNVGLSSVQRVWQRYEETGLLTRRSDSEFTAWLKLEEEENNVRYEKSEGIKRSGTENQKIYFNCSRSGKERREESAYTRTQKCQGSCKLNRNCTSQIIITLVIETGFCSMSYFKTHYGHEEDMQHMRLSKLKRESVASKLIAGVSVSQMDINNVMRSYNIGLKDGCRHKQDAVSVELWIQEMSGTENNPVVFYKPQNSECTAYNLENNDICLILMSPVQAELLKKFGQDLICVDSTHGLNAYDFEMTTVLVIDEFGNGFPVAFLFSNRKDSYINEVYFTEIMKVVGKIQTLCFMSDITSVFYLPWQKIMGTPLKQLYCSWHIDRAWQQNLGKVLDLDKRKWVYKLLKYIQCILDEDQFISDFNKFLNLLLSDDETKKMGDYVKIHYGKNVKQWAYCYRKSCPANTNMHLEAMHKTIKHVYLEGKKLNVWIKHYIVYKDL